MRIVLALLILVGCARDAKPAAPAPVGTVELHASCAPAVRRELNQAVALLHHMTYPQARAAFRAVASRDPTCAMAQWGIAMTRFTPLWPTRPSAADRQAGWEAARRAQELAPPTVGERALVAAVVAFFEHPESSDYWARVDRWESAMKVAHDETPDDVEVTAF
jgi:hypothetical protein